MVMYYNLHYNIFMEEHIQEEKLEKTYREQLIVDIMVYSILNHWQSLTQFTF